MTESCQILHKPFEQCWQAGDMHLHEHLSFPQVKPIMRALRKKANKAAKDALTSSAAYGQLMTVTHLGARTSQHARNMLKGEARLSDRALLTWPLHAAARVQSVSIIRHHPGRMAFAALTT